MIKPALNFIKYFLLLALPLLSGCNSLSSENKRPPVKRDTTINENSAYSNLSLDSTTLENYIQQNKVNDSVAVKMRNFYKSMNYHFAWFSNDGITEQARVFYNLHNTYVKAKVDTSYFDKQLHSQMEKLIDDDSFTLTPQQATETELHFTQHFFKYTKEVYEGTIDPTQLQWHIPKKKMDAVALLDSLIAKNGAKLESWEPVNRFYPLLRNEELKYYKIDKKGGWPAINLNSKAYRTGDSGVAVM